MAIQNFDEGCEIMNWPQWKIREDEEKAIAEKITSENFRDMLDQKQVFYNRGSCGSAIEFDSVGEPASGETVEKLLSDLRQIKQKAQNEEGRSLQEKKRIFDSLASVRLHEADIPDHQGWNPGVWTFLQLQLFDVVHWRWAKADSNAGAWKNVDGKFNISYTDRIFSRPVNRGCLSRLWLWNKVLIDEYKPEGKSDRHLIDRLQEDNKVAIIERTTASSDGRLALAIARKFSELPAPLAPRTVNNSQILRRVMKLVIFKMAGIETMSLDEQQLEEFVKKCFEEAQDENKWKKN
jgi:hypothetical protein